ncbi:OCIA domain-containing protein 1-like isoform X3 [Myxocyprinus asiaticus]|uniref:OCIA domain-containing protein 1-like isoform X3 n=1 Tax=Myxocyprinus asiaticus TaxID=70543 RepID=UPI00222330D0|nr:OCIA domain-containing protein 1-like isoform X3 [Myxocyprinus asiaticus]
MSQQSSEGFMKPEQPGQAGLGPMGIDYIPTEEEKRVFRECNQESFWYRFAGVFGYLGGKMSYMKTCQEKFKSLENSPLGEALRQRQHQQQPMFTREQSELSDPNKANFDQAFQLDDQRDQSFSYTRDFTYSDMPSPSKYDSQLQAELSNIEEDEQKQHPVLYEELQSKNKEIYEVTMIQKADTLLKPQTDRGKNIYGDAWEE